MSEESRPQSAEKLQEWLEPWQEVAGPLSALAAVVTSVVAIVAIRQTSKDSHERTRPLVVPFAQIGPSYVHGVLYLVVKNFGATAAHNVRVEFDPPLPEVEQKGNEQNYRDSSAATLRKRYAEPTKVLAPDQSLVNVWTNRAQEDRETKERESFEKEQKKPQEQDTVVPEIPERVALPESPNELTVSVHYEDGSRRKFPGLWRGPKTYSESVRIRMQDFDHESASTPGEQNDVSKRQAKAAEAAAWELWRR